MSKFLSISQANKFVTSLFPFMVLHSNKAHLGITIHYSGVPKFRLFHIIGMEMAKVACLPDQITEEELRIAVDELKAKTTVDELDKCIAMHKKHHKEYQGQINNLDSHCYEHVMKSGFINDGLICLEILQAAKENRAPIFKTSEGAAK